MKELKAKLPKRVLGRHEHGLPPRKGAIIDASLPPEYRVEGWYYTNAKTLDVVVDLRRLNGDYVGAITVRVKR